MNEPGPAVIAVDEQCSMAIDLQRWSRLATAAFVDQGVSGGECSVLFVDEATIRELNREHMGKDRPTDVLSFPLDGVGATHDDLIGDIVVCPTVAAANAADHEGQGHHRGTVDDELALLIVHGVLHLLGHDHQVDHEAEVMEALEQRILAAHHR